VIEFVLDGRSKVNTYMQLVQQVKQALRVGLLEPGDQLPKVRDVALALAIAWLGWQAGNRGAPRATRGAPRAGRGGATI